MKKGRFRLHVCSAVRYHNIYAEGNGRDEIYPNELVVDFNGESIRVGVEVTCDEMVLISIDGVTTELLSEW